MNAEITQFEVLVETRESENAYHSVASVALRRESRTHFSCVFVSFSSVCFALFSLTDDRISCNSDLWFRRYVCLVPSRRSGGVDCVRTLLIEILS